MKKIRALAIIGFVSFLSILQAEEGMWLPWDLKAREVKMQALGLTLSADQIYNEAAASLSDAVVLFGRGCTGEFVSEKGLLFTNHHCGYGYIQALSSVEKDYLSKGFWAENLADELACEGLTASLLINAENVTEKVLGGNKDSLAIRMAQLVAQAEGGDPTKKAEVKPYYYGNEYYLLTYDVFRDVRLVGAPPSSIGKFGGDTDNWVWPRHTGDFAVFRVYADSANRPAAYSLTNQVYTPKQYFRISSEGIQEGDFTFVLGYPGRTQEYLPSGAIELIIKELNPLRIDARTKRLDIIKNASAKDDLTRIQYAAKTYRLANAWKKWQGENKGIIQNKIIDKKQAFEDSLNWPVVKELNRLHKEMTPYAVMEVLFQENLLAPEIVSFAYSFQNLAKKSQENDLDYVSSLEKLKAFAKNYFKDYNSTLDKAIFSALSVLDTSDRSKIIRLVDFPDKDYATYLNELYSSSIFANEKKCMEFLDRYKISDYKKIEKDPAYQYAQIIYGQYQSQILPILASYQQKIDSLQSLYMRDLMMLENQKELYPDANLSLRLAYGKVAGMRPSDAVNYRYYSTLDGIIEKDDSSVADYLVDEKLKSLYQKKDFGSYTNEKGEVSVGFIATNHTSGGNSGSPVLNAKGELIGINFDRLWEGTMSDLAFDEAICRNIALDIRYCLFIIDKFAGAKRIIEEIGVK